MTIKEVSEQMGLTQDTLRYYERVGMYTYQCFLSNEAVLCYT